MAFELNGTISSGAECPAARAIVGAGKSRGAEFDFAPETLNVEVTIDDSVTEKKTLFKGAVPPHYKKYHINGEGCPPECAEGVATILLDSSRQSEEAATGHQTHR